MEHDHHFGEQYDDHYVDEHDYSLHHPEHDEYDQHPDVFHDADGDDDAYDPEAHDDAQTLDFEPSTIDYEPPSPSYPYPEDQQPPDLEIPLEDLDEHGDKSRNGRHISEIYNHDAVSGAELDHDNSVISEYLRSKDPDWDNVPQRTEPLTLLELPVDVLRLIVKEVCIRCPPSSGHALPHSMLPSRLTTSTQITHTNDLTSLALTNSTLHNLAIPHIYSRFDIVWPDAHTTTTEAKSVDALTYGLSTLCLGSTFARTTRRLRKNGGSTPGPLAKFAGNDYAKYTRKFSLGNGPNDWVSEYMINKESGKMLGTLVAMAIAKMVNLENFIWDMPTGVLSDIFMALASLADNSPSGQCNLERVWVRWHDNSENGASSSSSSSPGPTAAPTAVVPAGSTLTPIGISLPSTAAHPAPKPRIAYSENHVEYPTFSVLPPLKSLAVLDIDELAYLDEISELIERSAETLQELRIGISTKAIHHDFVQTWDGPELEQVDHNARWPGESSIGERRLGGILGVLVGRIYDIRRRPAKAKAGPPPALTPQSAGQSYIVTLQTPPAISPLAPPPLGDSAATPIQGEQTPSMSGAIATPKLDTSALSRPPSTYEPLTSPESGSPGRKRLDGKLKLTTLELERVPLSMQVCSKAFDWSVLSSLTILECAQHENLWKLLKKQFQPRPRESGYGISPTSSKPMPNAPLQYVLNLKHIHTDVTSPALINFVRETLAPNSLETLFLQDRRRSGGSAGSGPPPVTIETIFKGAIKRHRLSLRRLLLDSSAKSPSGGTNTESLRWRSWCLPTEFLLTITSGRLSNLRELSVSIEYKDWVSFGLTLRPTVVLLTDRFCL